jgi:RNA polymerase sigma-70 factor (ECF subfamily)
MSFSATTRFPAFRAPADSGKSTEEAAQAEARSIEITDEVLMEGICAGDREALAQLFRRYARVVRTVANRILRDVSEADDLLQEIFLFINRKCEIFDSSKGSARSWIVQITYHRAIDRRRYLSSRHFYTQVDIDGSAIEVPDPRADTLPYDQSMEGVLGRSALERIEKSLSEDQWTTMQLYFFEGFTIEEIAARLGQSVGNVRNHYYRGLEKVRKQMLSKKLRAD